jgi:anti-anti-sigma factor
MMELFRVHTDQSVNIVEMALPEHLDTSEFDRLNTAMLGLLVDDKTRGWVMDFSAVQYVGSAMLGLMVNFRQHVKSRKGKVVLCGLSGKLQEIIRTCCMDKLFPIAKNRADAIKLAL